MNPEKFFYQELGESNNDQVVKELEALGASVKKERSLENSYVATFRFGEATTSVGFGLNDLQTGADLVFKTLTTLPAEEEGKGWASRVIEIVIRWALANNLNNIKADQVQESVAGFWLKNGFEKIAEPNPAGTYFYKPE